MKVPTDIREGRHAYRLGWGDRPFRWFPDTPNEPTNRFDDPERQYQVLYASSDKLGAYTECISRFRHSTLELPQLEDFDGFQPTIQPGIVPESWFENRYVELAILKGNYADVSSASWTAYFAQHQSVKELLPDNEDYDISMLRGQRRELTQRISRIVYDMSNNDGSQIFAGIFYPSRFGDNLHNWAIFQPESESTSRFTMITVEKVSSTDSVYRQACDLLNIT